MSELRFSIQKSPRIPQLIADLYENMPVIEADRAELITESYQQNRESACHQAPLCRFPAHFGEHPHRYPAGRADRRLQLCGAARLSDLSGVFL